LSAGLKRLHENFTGDLFFVIIISELSFELIVRNEAGTDAMHMLALLTLIFETQTSVEVGELDGLHGVAEDFESECAEAFDIDSLSLEL